MRKREREHPCGLCGHYHKYEEGEICGICGHRLSDKSCPPLQVSAFPSEILPDFLYLGSYDNASRAELLKTQGIYRVLNTVPDCQNLYRNSFTYHCLQDDQNLSFDDANQFLEQCEKDRASVLVHCMSGKNRSPAIVIAYLMKSKGWRLAQSYQWVKERRPVVEITEAVYQQLQEYEQKIYGSNDNSSPALPTFSSGVPGFSFGFVKPSNSAPISAFNSASAAFNSASATSIFGIPTKEFTFRAVQTQNDTSGNPFSTNTPNPSGSDITMDGT